MFTIQKRIDPKMRLQTKYRMDVTNIQQQLRERNVREINKRKISF